MKLELIRPDDLVNLAIEAVNMRVDAADPTAPMLVVDDAARPARLIVSFPPQSIVESAYFEQAGITPDVQPGPGARVDQDIGKPPVSADAPPPPGTARTDALRVARIAGPSRLVFDVEKDTRIQLTIEGLLDWSAHELRVSPIAAIGPEPTEDDIAGAPPIQEPGSAETALELPDRLWISPNRDAAWQHRKAEFTFRGRTEVWHTRLVLPGQDGQGEHAHVPLRAIWSPDYDAAEPPPPSKKDPELGRTAIAPNDRHQLVVLTSAFHGYEVPSQWTFGPIGLPHALGGLVHAGVRLSLMQPYLPEPFYADQLILSPLGGWLRSRGTWTPPKEVAARPHRLHDLAGMFALDRLAVPSEALLPFVPPREPYQLDLSEWTHVASQGRDHYVRIVYEGVLLPFGNRASLVKVSERKFFEHDGIVGANLLQRMFIVVREPVRNFPHARGMPFKSVRLTTLVTPNIADPDAPASKVPGSNRSFWVMVALGGTPVAFPFHAVGTDAGDNDVDFTIPMMFVSMSETGDVRKLVLNTYNTGAKAQGEAKVPGQKVIFARTDNDKAPDGLNAQLVTETLDFVVDTASEAPSLQEAGVQIPQVSELLGSDAPTSIRLFKGYVDNGLGSSNGVFAEIATGSLGVDFAADKAGGFATPDLDVKSISDKLGPLGAKADEAVANTFNAATFFGSAAQLFGSFGLADVLDGSDLEANAPKLTTQRKANELVTTLDWTPALRERDLTIAKFTPGGTKKLEVKGEITKALSDGAGETTSSFTGTLGNFDIEVLKAVVVHFDEFSFTKRTNHKPDVTVALKDDPVEFTGDLEFVDELRRAIPPGLFGDGPSIDLTDNPVGVRAGFAVALPPLEVGVFALKDVSLGAALTLPFTDGKPALDFNFSSREHPFLLAVTIFGGGGFFHLQLDAAGIKQLEAALEFGATASLNLGVASGSVHMMAGIYFSLERRGPTNELKATLAGYLRVGGSLEVLAIITISVEFNLTFAYVEEGKAYGRATLTVQVEVAFFSKSVELSVEKTFGGQGGDPKFIDQFKTASTWAGYAKAFAA